MPRTLSSTPAAFRPAWRDVVSYGALSAIGPLTIDMYLAGLPAIVKDLQASQSLAGLTLTATMAGIAIGQLIVGAISDQLGRHRPLVVALGGYVLVSLGCSLATSIWVLLLLRFLQGLTAAAGIVLSQAMVRDRFSGSAMAQVVSKLMLVSGVAPILAPWLGAQFLKIGDWRTIFLGLTGCGVLLFLNALFVVKETLPMERRRTGGLPEVARNYRALLTDSRFIGMLLTGSFAFGCLFVYVSSAPHLYQEQFGLSPEQYAQLFAAGSIAIVSGGQVNGRVVRSRHPVGILLFGQALAAASCAFLILCGLAGWGLVAIVVGIMGVMFATGLVLPNSGLLALNDHPTRAGSAAALIAASNFSAGALVAAVATAVQGGGVLAMAILMLACLAVSVVGFGLLARPREIRAALAWPTQLPGTDSVDFEAAVARMLEVSRAYDAELGARHP